MTMVVKVGFIVLIKFKISWFIIQQPVNLIFLNLEEWIAEIN